LLGKRQKDIKKAFFAPGTKYSAFRYLVVKI